MATAAVEQPTEAAPPAVPDYVLDPNAVLKDDVASWRYGRAPDYSKTRTYWQETKSKDHAAGSLESIVENLVKNWEVEASFKTKLADWRTIDHDNYTFAMNGGAPQTGEHMLKVGTYNAIVAPNEYYSPANSDFSSSHKTFKRMMPTFAWEVLEVYSGPPRVAFRWRHWGVMKNDYVGFNDKAEKVTAKAHGGTIDIEGVTVALVDDKLRVQKLETWFDSMEMFRQIAPHGVVNKEPVGRRVANGETITEQKPAEERKEKEEQEEHEDEFHEVEEKAAEPTAPKTTDASEPAAGGIPESDPAAERAASANPFTPDTTLPIRTSPSPSQTSIYSTAVTGPEEPQPPTTEENNSTHDAIDEQLSKPAAEVHPFPHDMEDKVKPSLAPGEAVVTSGDSSEAAATYEEMSRVTPAQCPFMNRE